MKFNLDPNLEEYATEKQWSYLKAIAEHGSERAAARELGITASLVGRAKHAVLRKATNRGYSPDHNFRHTVPDGQKLRGVSTHYNKDGEVTAQWVKSQEDRERQAEILEEMAEGFAADLPQAHPVLQPSTEGAPELMACYPVGDHHMGMLAWDKETGGDYDLGLSEQLLMGAMNHLIGLAPDCETATIVLLGDFMHYDSFVPETPRGKNQLDADSRFPRMVKFAIRSIRYLIRRALTKHHQVNLIIEIGNHDPASAIFLMSAMESVYELEPRVSVDTSPMHYHYFTHGKVLVGVHHGHGAKMADLPLIMATDRPEAWGASAYRYWWTGHVHHDQTKDYRNVKVESFRILAPSDAWAHQKGYRSMQDMKCIVLHKDFGEVARYTVNPEMLK
tara:strand:+ start:5382 stop:6551 length:1170 start_codon:yes stop_codon:yes gene_type:complete